MSAELNVTKTAVISCARDWWRSMRPMSFSREDHLANPTINTKSPSEGRLAEAVAAMIKAGGSP